MYVVLLKFSDKKALAPQFLDGHKAWLQRGYADGVFLLTGSLLPNSGGAILAHGVARAELDQRIQDDPFVAEGIVTAEVIEIAPSRANDQLSFLVGT